MQSLSWRRQESSLQPCKQLCWYKHSADVRSSVCAVPAAQVREQILREVAQRGGAGLDLPPEAAYAQLVGAHEAARRPLRHCLPPDQLPLLRWALRRQAARVCPGARCGPRVHRCGRRLSRCAAAPAPTAASLAMLESVARSLRCELRHRRRTHARGLCACRHAGRRAGARNAVPRGGAAACAGAARGAPPARGPPPASRALGRPFARARRRRRRPRRAAAACCVTSRGRMA